MEKNGGRRADARAALGCLEFSAGDDDEPLTHSIYRITSRRQTSNLNPSLNRLFRSARVNGRQQGTGEALRKRGRPLSTGSFETGLDALVVPEKTRT